MTLISGHCPIPAPHWDQPVGKARHCRPADNCLSICKDPLAGAGPILGTEVGASAGHGAAPAPTGSFCPLALCIPGGAARPLLLGAGSWRRAAAEAALGSSPPELNGTFVGDAGGSMGLAGTRSVSPGVTGALPTSNVQFFPGEHGDAVAGMGYGGFCGIPLPPYTLGTPWCPHPALGTLQRPFSSHMRHHNWEESLGAWWLEGDCCG